MVTRVFFPCIPSCYLIGPTKSSPHFINGSSRKLVTSFARLWVANPPILWHASQDLQQSCTSLYIVGHQYPPSIKKNCVILVAKWPLNGPSCNSLITIYVSIVVKHLLSLLSWPILYNSPFFNVNGCAVLTNLCFYYINNVPSIYPIFKKKFTSFNHSGYM